MQKSQLWYKDAIIYELYVRAFKDSNGDGHGDLQGLISKLDYLQDLGITCLWILPTYPSPLVDDGYDIADYYAVHQHYGTLSDFKALVAEIHSRGMRIIVDLVLNHTSDQHPWFLEARQSPDSPYHDYYVWSETDQKYPEARVIFNDSLDSNWTWEPQVGKYYWHRFYPQQPDLNYDNPKVQDEMLKIIDFWLGLGVDGFRADAVPYLFEREGTNCDNLPETHAYLKRVRQLMDDNYSNRILLMEANQMPEDVRHYFGDGSEEAHMAFHFPIMPRIFMALRKADRTPIVETLSQTPEIPINCQWCTFLRNHDELTLEMVSPQDRQWMWEQYAPDARMRLNLGIRRRLAPLLENDPRKIKLLNSILFTLPGSPVIYYGDEIGMGDNIWLHDRNGVRTPMQWENSPNAGFSSAPVDKLYLPIIDTPEFSLTKVNTKDQAVDPHSLFNATKRMIAIRKNHPSFGWGDFQWAELMDDNPALMAYWRSYEDENILVINNLSEQLLSARLALPENIPTTAKDLLSNQQVLIQHQELIDLEMPPYGYMWIKFLAG